MEADAELRPVQGSQLPDDRFCLPSLCRRLLGILAGRGHIPSVAARTPQANHQGESPFLFGTPRVVRRPD